MDLMYGDLHKYPYDVQQFLTTHPLQVHYLVHGRIGDFVVTDPMVRTTLLDFPACCLYITIQVLGHESSGVVFKGILFA